MSGFPDGWSVSQYFPPGSAIVFTLPAIPGIAHVITSIELIVVGGTATLSGGIAEDGATTDSLPWGLPSGAAGGGVTGSSSWSGQKTAPAGKSLSVSYGTLPSGNYAVLQVSGYPI